MQKRASRKSSLSSNKSYHSIDQFRYSNPLEAYSKANRFPIRQAINIILILLTTLQVYILVHSRIYLRGELVRTFLSVYVDEKQYPDLFDGKQFYLEVIDVQQMKQHFEYMFDRVNVIANDSFVDFYYQNAKFILHTEYREFAGGSRRESVHPVDPRKGIRQPFNMSNITDIQLYLLQVEQFQLQIDNLTMRENWEGFTETYSHRITYQFVDSIKVQINFEFGISNAMVGEDQHARNSTPMVKCGRLPCVIGYQDQIPNPAPNLKQASFPTVYIVKVRLFYALVLVLALLSLYLNFISIRNTFKILYEELSTPNDQPPEMQEQSQLHLMEDQEIHEIRHDVRQWVKINRMTVTSLKIEHYFHILQFDVIFSTLSNVFEIIAAFYLVSGIERERIAGVTCLFSWLTIFKFVRNYKKLVLMYELIKLSIAKVASFFVQFLPVFISYALLGLCLFPKVAFFSSLANSVTTLVCLMMGDSIEMITDAILEKNSVLLSMVYIFSFVLLFMHAIHNTLTSLIKEFFIIKKIELVKWEKARSKEDHYIYIDQLKTNSEAEKQKLPLKLTPGLATGLLRIRALARTKGYSQAVVLMCQEIEYIRIEEKWLIGENHLGGFPQVKEEIVRRSMRICNMLEEFDVEDTGAGGAGTGGMGADMGGGDDSPAQYVMEQVEEVGRVAGKSMLNDSQVS